MLDNVDFGENLDGPVDWDVPVLNVAVASVLDRPMRPVPGSLRFAYREVE
jgi:hypothetical protein